MYDIQLNFTRYTRHISDLQTSCVTLPVCVGLTDRLYGAVHALDSPGVSRVRELHLGPPARLLSARLSLQAQGETHEASALLQLRVSKIFFLWVV